MTEPRTSSSERGIVNSLVDKVGRVCSNNPSKTLFLGMGMRQGVRRTQELDCYRTGGGALTAPTRPQYARETAQSRRASFTHPQCRCSSRSAPATTEGSG